MQLRTVSFCTGIKERYITHISSGISDPEEIFSSTPSPPSLNQILLTRFQITPSSSQLEHLLHPFADIVALFRKTVWLDVLFWVDEWRRVFGGVRQTDRIAVERRVRVEGMDGG